MGKQRLADRLGVRTPTSRRLLHRFRGETQGHSNDPAYQKVRKLKDANPEWGAGRIAEKLGITVDHAMMHLARWLGAQSYQAGGSPPSSKRAPRGGGDFRDAGTGGTLRWQHAARRHQQQLTRSLLPQPPHSHPGRSARLCTGRYAGLGGGPARDQPLGNGNPRANRRDPDFAALADQSVAQAPPVGEPPGGALPEDSWPSSVRRPRNAGNCLLLPLAEGMLELSIMDLHLGKLAWGEETRGKRLQRGGGKAHVLGRAGGLGRQSPAASNRPNSSSSLATISTTPTSSAAPRPLAPFRMRCCGPSIRSRRAAR